MSFFEYPIIKIIYYYIHKLKTTAYVQTNSKAETAHAAHTFSARAARRNPPRHRTETEIG